MGYISSPTLSGMSGGPMSGLLDTGSTRSPFLSSNRPDYGKLPSFQDWANSPKIDTDRDGIPNSGDNEFRNRDRG
jgi:hypothetical protein